MYGPKSREMIAIWIFPFSIKQIRAVAPDTFEPINMGRHHLLMKPIFIGRKAKCDSPMFCHAVDSLKLLKRDLFTVLPDAVEVIEIPCLLVKDMDDDAFVVEKRPVGVAVSFDMIRLEAGF